VKILGQWTVLYPDATDSHHGTVGEAVTAAITSMAPSGSVDLYGPDEAKYTLVHRMRGFDVQITKTL